MTSTAGHCKPRPHHIAGRCHLANLTAQFQHYYQSIMEVSQLQLEPFFCK